MALDEPGKRFGPPRKRALASSNTALSLKAGSVARSERRAGRLALFACELLAETAHELSNRVIFVFG